MTLQEAWQNFVQGMQLTTWYEYLAVFSGIASVWFSRKENILVYPVGLINTIIYIYISIEGDLYGEASVNLYYTVMSIYGWIVWYRRDKLQQPVLHVQYSSARLIAGQLLFFIICYGFIFAGLNYLKKDFAEGAIPWADAFASAAAFTGMWLMTRKKVESWYWWMATNVASIPLYFVKGYVFTSMYYVVLLIIAFLGLSEWRKKANRETV